jgi:hypothetical protein
VRHPAAEAAHRATPGSGDPEPSPAKCSKPTKVYDIELCTVVLTDEQRNQLRRTSKPIFPASYSEALNEVAESTAEILALKELAVDQWSRLRRHKSNPEVVRRNVKIIDSREADRKRWTVEALAQEDHLGERTVKRILSQREHWKHLASLQGDKI